MNPFNVCTFIGHVPNHPSFKPSYVAGDDQKRSRYSAALSVRRNVKKQGEQYYPEDLIRFTAWGTSADFLNNYAPPGTTIAISGSLNVDTVEKDGNKVTYHTIMVDNARIVYGNNNGEHSNQAEQRTEQSMAQQPVTVTNPFHKGQNTSASPVSSDQSTTQKQTVERLNPFSKRSQ